MRRFPERFEILRLLGEGGMGVVHEAFDRTRNEIVALKTLRHTDAEAIYRLKREFRALANLEHPNLVRLHDLFVEPDACFFTMELVEGVDLATYVSSHAASDATADTLASGVPALFDEPSLRHALAGLLRGLEALHGAGLLHRDLKPSNVLVTPQGRVVVLDFGLVVDAHAAVQQTMQGAVTGTVAYMAPEQARGESELTTACDLYAVGVILYELLTGRAPFQGPALRVMLAKQTDEAPRASRSHPSVPEDLDALAHALMARDPASRPRLTDALARLGAAPSRTVPFTSSSVSSAPRVVGRDAEIARLERVYRQSHAGRPALALVRGRSGIGKSALLSAFARRCEGAGAVVLSGRCYESESVPFKGLDGIVDALSRVLAMASPEELGRILPPNLGDLGTLFPVLRRIPPIAAAYARRDLGERSVQRMRTQGFACLRELLRRLGETSPLLVVLDDVQWADEDSARGLVDLVRGEHPPAMLLLLGARPRDDAPVVRNLFGDDVSESIAAIPREVLELRPLPLAAMREIAERELGAQSPLVELVARDAHGLPFAAGELARFLREGDVEETSIGGTPPIDAIVRRRVAKLDDAARRVLEMIAVAGEPTPARIVHRALAMQEDDRSAIDVLRGRAFVKSVRTASSVSIDTAHDRIREAVLESLPEATRAELHRRLAVAMESLETPPHDALARHFAAAGEKRLGRHHACAAAEEASAALAFLRAAGLYALALELSDDDERGALLPPYADALAAAGRYVDAAEVWLEASSRASGQEARERKRRAAECWLYAGRIDEGLDLLDALANELGVRIPDDRWAVFWELVKGHVRLAFRGLGFRIRPTSEVPKSELDRLRTLGAIAVQYGPLDAFRGAVPSLRYLLAALDVGELDELSTALGINAAHRAALGFGRGASRLIRVLENLVKHDASGRALAMTFLARSFVFLFTAGDRRAAATSVDRAFEQIATLPMAPAWLLSLAHYSEAWLLRFEVSVAAFARGLSFVAGREEQSGPCAELRLRALLLQSHHLLVGRPELVIEYGSDSARWMSATKRDIALRTIALSNCATAHLYLGDVPRAHELAERVRDGFRRQGVWRITTARGSSLASLAAVALVQGDAGLAHRCVREFGRPRDALGRIFARILASLAAAADRDERVLRRTLVELRELALDRGFPLYETLACWGLGRLDSGPPGDEPRARYLALLESTGTVDPDLYFWARFPLGERPARSGSQRSSWSPRPAPPIHVDERDLAS